MLMIWPNAREFLRTERKNDGSSYLITNNNNILNSLKTGKKYNLKRITLYLSTRTSHKIFSYFDNILNASPRPSFIMNSVNIVDCSSLYINVFLAFFAISRFWLSPLMQMFMSVYFGGFYNLCGLSSFPMNMLVCQCVSKWRFV